MGIEEYIDKVVRGDLADPTLTQLRAAVVRDILWHYLTTPARRQA